MCRTSEVPVPSQREVEGLGIRVRRDRLLDPSDERYLGRRDDLSHVEGRSVHLGARAAHS
jgi:hypothetical protein